MTLLAFILIALAAILTLFVPALAVSIDQLVGHDAAASNMQYFFACAPRWLLVAAVLGIVIAWGGFGWVSRSVLVQCLVVLAVHATLGIVSILSAMTMRGGESMASVGFWVFSVVVPAVVLVYCGLALASPATAAQWWARAPIVIVAALAVVGGVVAVTVYERTTRETRQKIDDALRAMDEAKARRLAEIEAMPRDAPLLLWLPLLKESDDELRERAAGLIADRKTLPADLAALLPTEDRVAALQYMWLRMPRPPKELAEPTRDSIAGLPEWARKRLDSHDSAQLSQVADACEASVAVADYFPDSEVDFRPAMAGFSAFLDAHPDSWTERGRTLLHQWLASDPGRTP